MKDALPERPAESNRSAFLLRHHFDDAGLGVVVVFHSGGGGRNLGDGAAPLILAKAMKPRQPKFLDLPTIGPETITKAAAAGIAAVVVEAQRSLVVNRSEVSERASSLGISVLGLRARRV